jgi:purine-binding chemotaxis protein CheW
MPLRIVTFTLGDQLYGLDILWVREIVRNFEVAPVDRVPAHIAGLVNLRGQLLTVFDLRIRMGLDSDTPAKRDCIVLKTAGELERLATPPADSAEAVPELVGLLVDRIGDVLEQPDDAIEPPPANRGNETAWIRGVVPLDGRLLVVLRPGALLANQSTSVST